MSASTVTGSGSGASEKFAFSRSRKFWSILAAAVAFAFVAPTRLDITILLPEVMKGIGVTALGVGGLISTLTVLGDGIAEPFMGRLADITSRRLALAGGTAVLSLFTLLTAFSGSLGTMIPVRILIGVGAAAVIPAYFAFLGSTYGNQRGFILGSLAGLFTVGAAINPITTRGSFNAFGHSWQAPFILYAIFGFLLALAIAYAGRGRFYEVGAGHVEHRPSAISRHGVLSRDMILLLATMALWGLTQYGFLGLFVTFLRTHQHFSLGSAAAVASVASWVSFAFSFFGGWISDRIGRRNMLIILGSVGVLVAYPVFAYSGSFWGALILASIFQAANGCFYPLGVAYSQDLAAAGNIGVHSGTTTGIGHLVAGFAGVITGSIAASAGFLTVGWVFAAASILMVVFIVMTRDPVHQARLAGRTAAANG
jgi:MFS family permease